MGRAAGQSDARSQRDDRHASPLPLRQMPDAAVK
jgi:hypothetical protein